MDMNELACAIRGPVTLITIGTLFAIDHFTAYGIGRTWPVLLIVFGTLSLMARGGANRSASGGTGPGGMR
jgi:hypothetical protein